MKKLFLFSTLFFSCTTMLIAQFEPEKYKHLSNAEFVLELKNAVEQIKAMERFSSIFDEKKEKFYAKDELEPAFKLDTAIALRAFNEFRNSRFQLFHAFADGQATLQLDDGDFHGSLEGQAYRIKMVPKRIYFYDGTVTDSVADIKMDFSFAEDIPFRKRIDSIACDMRLDYTTKMDKVEVSTQKPWATYKGDFIKLVKADKNDLELIYSKDLDFNFVEGLNSSGSTLDSKSYSTTDIKDRGFKVFTAIRTPLEKIIDVAEKDTNLSTSAFQEKYIALLEKELMRVPDSDTMLRVAKYKGAVKGARFWFATAKHNVTVPVTVRAASFSDIHLETTKNHSVLLNNDGEELIKVDKGIRAINSRFYEDEKTFFFFDLAQKKMKALPYYSLEKLTDNYVVVKEDEDAADILINNNNEPLGRFDHIGSSGETVIAEKDNDVLIIAPDHKQTRYQNVETISDMENEHACISLNGKYGFVNAHGMMIIPAGYDDAKPFDDMDGYTKEDLLFAVKKNDKWGFVNVLNKIIIPFEYDEVLPFSYGITMAAKGDRRGLIDTSNRVVVPFNNGASFGLSKNFGKRTYSLSTGSYDHSGRKEK